MRQATLASRLGVSQPAVSRLERNLNRMMVATLRAVVQASNDRWQILSRPEKLFSHPARFPVQVPLFLVRFLTDPGDLVLDPYAGSNTTGEICEAEEIAESRIFGENGASKPSEGFAEFGQLLLATPSLTRKHVREVLPRCLKVWEAHGL